MTSNFEVLTKKVSDLCTSILSHQSTSSTTSTDSSEQTVTQPPPSILTIRSDFIQLSTHLGKECTALTLACKPKLSLVAVEGTLNNLFNLLLKFRVCLNACPPVGALAKEIKWIAYELTEALQRLVESSLESHRAPTPKKAASLRTLNLSLTGQVWEKVELASHSLSATELEATRKDWKSVLELLDDCLEEVKEMEEEPIEQDEGYAENEEEEDEDDYRNHNPLSELEREKVKAAHMLLRLGRLLLKRLITSTAPPPPPASNSKKSIPSSSTSTTTTTTSSSSSSSSSTATSPYTSPYTSTSFLTNSTPLVQLLSETADDFAASLEPPQSMIVDTSIEFEKAGTELSQVIELALNEFGSTTIEGGEEVKEGEEEREKEVKWLVMWREQVGKARKKLLSLGVATDSSEEVVAVEDDEEVGKESEVVV